MSVSVFLNISSRLSWTPGSELGVGRRHLTLGFQSSLGLELFIALKYLSVFSLSHSHGYIYFSFPIILFFFNMSYLKIYLFILIFKNYNINCLRHQVFQHQSHDQSDLPSTIVPNLPPTTLPCPCAVTNKVTSCYLL